MSSSFQYYRYSYIGIGVIILLVGIIYLSTILGSPFVLDDAMHIANNPAIRSFTSVIKTYWLHNARFFGYLTLLFNYRLNTLSVTGYHIFSIVLHTLNTVLVWYFFTALLRSEGHDNKITRHPWQTSLRQLGIIGFFLGGI